MIEPDAPTTQASTTQAPRDALPSAAEAAESCILAGAFQAATCLFTALGLLAFGLPRVAAGAALMGGLLWATSILHWALARLAQQRLAARRPARHSAMYQRPSIFSSTYWSNGRP